MHRHKRTSTKNLVVQKSKIAFGYQLKFHVNPEFFFVRRQTSEKNARTSNIRGGGVYSVTWALEVCGTPKGNDFAILIWYRVSVLVILV